MKLKELKDMTLTQIWDKFKKPFNFAWKAGIIFMAVCIACGLFSEFMGWQMGIPQHCIWQDCYPGSVC